MKIKMFKKIPSIHIWTQKDYSKLLKENKALKMDNIRLKMMYSEKEWLCNEKDAFFNELISDGLRHGSKLAAKHMADRKSYIMGKY